MVTIINISVTKMRNHTGNTLGTKLPAEVLTEDEVEALLKQCSRRAPTGIRNRALLMALYRGMLRISEALDLKPADVNLDEQTIRIRKGKGSKARTVGIPGSVCDAIAKWVEERKALRIGPSKPLFCGIEKGLQRSNRGDRLDASYIRHLLPRLAAKAGITKRVHPHGFRHSGAVRMLRSGKDVGIISKGLGHSSIATTHRYLDHLHPEVVIAAMKEE